MQEQINFRSESSNYQQNIDEIAQNNEYSFLQCFSGSANQYSLTAPKTYNNSLLGISRPLPLSTAFGESSSSLSSKSTAKSPNEKELNKYSEDYKQKREKNNIAVRKSREKAKRRLKLNEARINELIAENEQLKNRIEVMTRVMNGLRSLLITFGYTNNKIDYEISKTLANGTTN